MLICVYLPFSFSNIDVFYVGNAMFTRPYVIPILAPGVHDSLVQDGPLALPCINGVIRPHTINGLINRSLGL